MRLLALVALLGACSERVRLVLALPGTGSQAYDLRWRAGARLTLESGAEREIESLVTGRLLLEPGGASEWRARIEGARQQLRAPPESGIRPDPAGLAGLVFVLARPPGDRPSASALARPPGAVLPLLSPKTAVIAAAFPPLPDAAIRRGHRWEAEATLSWPHPEGTLDGKLRLRLRLSDLRRVEGKKLATVRLHGDAELRSLSARAPSYRGALRADVSIDVESGALRRAIVEDEWLASVRDAEDRPARMKTRGEWTIERAP